MVLGRRAHHGRSSDIDVFDSILETAVRVGNGLLKRVQVDHHQVDRRDAMLRHDPVVDTAAPENAAVHFGMQGFYPSRHHFRKAGVIGDFGHRDAGLGDQPGGAAGGQ